jgi:hypothetical protein
VPAVVAFVADYSDGLNLLMTRPNSYAQDVSSADHVCSAHEARSEPYAHSHAEKPREDSGVKKSKGVERKSSNEFSKSQKSTTFAHSPCRLRKPHSLSDAASLGLKNSKNASAVALKVGKATRTNRVSKGRAQSANANAATLSLLDSANAAHARELMEKNTVMTHCAHADRGHKGVLPGDEAVDANPSDLNAGDRNGLSEGEYEVGAILAERCVRRKAASGKMSKQIFYKVQWKGYSAEWDSWVPAHDLGNAREAVREFKQRDRERQKKKKNINERGTEPDKDKDKNQGNDKPTARARKKMKVAD